MADQWVFKSETYDNCNCAVNCGCQFNLRSTHRYCQSAYAGTVVEGHFNGTPLAGLKWAGLYKCPGEIADGAARARSLLTRARTKPNATPWIRSSRVGLACR